MASEHTAPSVISAASSAAKKAMDEWLKANGEQSLIALGTVFMWGAAAHAVYLATVPEPLRVSVAKRNQRLWKGLSLGALLAIAGYDSLHSARLADQHRQLQASARHLWAQIRSYSGHNL